MNFIKSIGGIIAIAIKFSILFSFYYIIVTIKKIVTVERKQYNLSEKEYNSWRTRNICIHGLLASMFFLMFLFSIMNIRVGTVIALIVIVIAYIWRIKNNLSQIK